MQENAKCKMQRGQGPTSLGIEVGPWDAGKIKFVPPAGGLNPEVHNLQIIARKQCGAG
jgi:hypothetical protein